MVIVTNKVAVNKPVKSKSLITVSGAQTVDNIIKSVRVYEKDDKVHLDYRVYPEYRRDGKERIRFSSGQDATKRAINRMEKEKYTIALSHFLEKHEVSDGNIYFKDIAHKAIEEDRGNRAEDIHSDYLTILENYILPIFGEKMIDDIKVSELKAWKNGLLTNKKLSKSRYVKYHRTLNFVFKYAYLNEIIMRNPMDLIDKRSKLFKLKSSNNDSKYYDIQEAQRMMKEANGWFQAFLTVAFYTGMRTGELISLQWDDLDFAKNQITVQRSKRHGKLKETTKSGVHRVIDMPSPVLEALRALYQVRLSELWIFPNSETKEAFYEPSTITRYKLKPLLKKLGIEYKTLYATRHSFASLSVEKNIPLTYVQKQLGHAKLSTTMDFYVKNGLINQNSRDIRVDTLFN